MPALPNFPNYSQADGQWDYLANAGLWRAYACGVCCAANITQYKEKITITPATMKSRGVFTASNLECQWYNASKQFGWGGEELTGNNVSGVLKEIKNQIDRYSDPCVLRLGTSTSRNHFVTVYGYNNSCTQTSDVLIRDSEASNCKTLAEALAKPAWSYIHYLKRII